MIRSTLIAFFLGLTVCAAQTAPEGKVKIHEKDLIGKWKMVVSNDQANSVPVSYEFGKDGKCSVISGRSTPKNQVDWTLVDNTLTLTHQLPGRVELQIGILTDHHFVAVSANGSKNVVEFEKVSNQTPTDKIQ